MKLENQVTSLKLSRKLKKLGVKQESLYYWHYNSDYDRRWVSTSKPKFGTDYSAFTVAELGEMLPKSIIVENVNYWLQIEVQGAQNGWSCQYINHGTSIRQVIKFFEDRTMANAGAKMLIYLRKNNLLKPK